MLLIVEALMPGIFLAVPGMTLLVASIFLFVAPGSLGSTAATVVLPTTAVVSAMATLTVYRRLGRTNGESTVPQVYHLPGKDGLVTLPIPAPPGRGEVLVGERHWDARAENPIPRGVPIRVVRVEEHTLVVEEVA